MKESFRISRGPDIGTSVWELHRYLYITHAAVWHGQCKMSMTNVDCRNKVKLDSIALTDRIHKIVITQVPT